MTDEDEPLTLAEACQILFRGTISPATLRAEAARGRLVIEKIGRRHFVTRAGIKRMRALCVLKPSDEPRGGHGSQVGEDQQVQRAFDAAMVSVQQLRPRKERDGKLLKKI